MSKSDERKPLDTFIVGDAEWAVRDKYSNYTPEVLSQPTEVPDFIGRLTITLIEKWGIVAATDGGEDKSGRAKLALQEPSAVVDRAYDIAQLTDAKLRAGGHFHKTPGFNTLFGLEPSPSLSPTEGDE